MSTTTFEKMYNAVRDRFRKDESKIATETQILGELEHGFYPLETGTYTMRGNFTATNNDVDKPFDMARHLLIHNQVLNDRLEQRHLQMDEWPAIGEDVKQYQDTETEMGVDDQLPIHVTRDDEVDARAKATQVALLMLDAGWYKWEGSAAYKDLIDKLVPQYE